MEQLVLTVKDLSQLLNTPERTLRHWASNNTLPSYKIGEKVFFNRAEIMNLLGGEKIVEEKNDPIVDWLTEELNKRRKDKQENSAKDLQIIPHKQTAN